MRPIETLETFLGPGLGPELAVRLHWCRRDVQPFRPAAADEKNDITAHAEVNHGRWLVRCPFCRSASLASRGDHRFFCVECLNEPVGGRWLRVIWPRKPEDIEAALNERPERCFANWRPGQTVASLRAATAAGFHHSWTAPQTWVVGQVVDASDMNTDIRDNMLETLPARAVDAVLTSKFFW